MTTTDKLSLNDKIREIRKFIGISQANLAKASKCGIGTISRIENGQSTCSDDLLSVIRGVLGIKNAPLLEGEDIIFRERLHIWRDTINSGSTEKSKHMQKDLAVILCMPFEHDLAMLYIMYEIKLLMSDNNFADAEKWLNLIGRAIDNADDGEFAQEFKGDYEERFHYHHISKCSLKNLSTENLYHYYFNMGSLMVMTKRYKEGLGYYLKAGDLYKHIVNKEISLVYNIACCYLGLCMPYRSILYLEKAGESFRSERTSILGLHLDNILAVSYMYAGETDQAYKLLQQCLVRAKSIENQAYIGMVSHNLGQLYLKTNNPEQALGLFDMAFEQLEPGHKSYLENLYYKLHCLIELKDFRQWEKLLADAKEMSENDENYLLLFDSIGHLKQIKNNDSCEYLKDVAIPHMLKAYEYFKALDYCRSLEATFRSKRQIKKALEVAAIMRDIYEMQVAPLD